MCVSYKLYNIKKKLSHLFPHTCTPSIISTWTLIKGASYRYTCCWNWRPIYQWLPHRLPLSKELIITVIVSWSVCGSYHKSQHKKQSLQVHRDSLNIKHYGGKKSKLMILLGIRRPERIYVTTIYCATEAPQHIIWLESNTIIVNATESTQLTAEISRISLMKSLTEEAVTYIQKVN